MDWNLDEAIGYYKGQGAPGDQSALIHLLREVQQENSGGIPGYCLEKIADAYGVKLTFLHAVIRRIPGLRLEDSHLLEICAGPNCGKHAALAEYAEKLCLKNDRVKLKFVPCMRMCGKGPNIRLDGRIYHGATEELLQKLMEEM